MSKTRKGVKKSEEHKRNIGISHKGWIPSEETRKKIGEKSSGRISAMKGKHLSEETKQKIREWNLLHNPKQGKKLSEETKAKMRHPHKKESIYN